MPVGVDVTTAVRSGPTGATGDEAATYFVAGQTELGPIDKPVALYSLADYIAVFGQRVTYGALYDDLRTHFEEHGVRAVVARTVGAGATFGTLILKDQATVTALNTLQITAAFPGARSTGVTVQILAGSTAALFTIAVFLDGVQKESYTDLASPADAANQTQKSWFIRCTDLGSATAAPLNNPAPIAQTALSAGNDDRASITAATHVASLARFGETAIDRTGQLVLLGAGIVAIPGQPATAVMPGIAAHCKLRSREALASNPVGTSQATALANTASIISAIGVTGGLEYCAGIVFPGIRIPDVGNVIRTITAEGYVAAGRARAILEAGPERSAIGKISEADFVIEPEVLLDRTTANSLDQAHLIPIRSVRGTVRVYGWRSLSSDPNYKLVKHRDLLNAIQIDATNLLEDLVGSTIDGSGHLSSKVQAAMIGLLDPIAKRGGLYPLNGDPGYSVDVSGAINTLATAANDVEAVVIGVRIAETAEQILLTIVKAALAANL